MLHTKHIYLDVTKWTLVHQRKNFDLVYNEDNSELMMQI